MKAYRPESTHHQDRDKTCAVVNRMGRPYSQKARFKRLTYHIQDVKSERTSRRQGGQLGAPTESSRGAQAGDSRICALLFVVRVYVL